MCLLTLTRRTTKEYQPLSPLGKTSSHCQSAQSPLKITNFSFFQEFYSLIWLSQFSPGEPGHRNKVGSFFYFSLLWKVLLLQPNQWQKLFRLLFESWKLWNKSKKTRYYWHCNKRVLIDVFAENFFFHTSTERAKKGRLILYFTKDISIHFSWKHSEGGIVMILNLLAQIPFRETSRS